MSDIKENPVEDKIEKPASRWRNRVVVVKNYVSKEGNVRKVGDVFCGENVWPSKEVAEQKAADCMKKENHTLRVGSARYLGAFPEGQDANH